MPEASPRRHRPPSFWFIVALLFAVPTGLLAQAGQGAGRGGAAPAGQGRGGGPGGPPAAGPGAKGAAPVDLTGYWVSIVTEDWIERMSPDSPPSGTGGRGGGGGGGRGGAGGPAPVVSNPGEPCRAYGAAGSLRVPGRLNITWVDDNTLKVDMDSGTQTRLFHFAPATPPPADKTLQGYSVATWEAGGGARGGGRGGPAPAVGPRWGSLNVVTTNMSGGYLLSSRSSYSNNAVLTEYFTRHSDFGADYFTVTAMVQDGPQTRVTSSTFKKEPNASKFSPGPCEVVR